MSATQQDLFAPRLYADVPRARAKDPESSHLAAAEVKASGRLACQQSQVLAAVRQWVGFTSRELAAKMQWDRYILARRLPELEAAFQVRKGSQRECLIGRRQAVTWYPR